MPGHLPPAPPDTAKKPRGLLGRWERSLQFRTVASTLLLCAIAFVGIGAFLSHQIAGALYAERLDQYKVEASNALRQVDEQFSASTASDRASTEALALNGLNTLGATGFDERRSYILTPFPGPNVWIQPKTSPGISPTVIPETLSEAVKNGKGQYYEAISLQQDGKEIPAIAFGQRVKLPPNNDYALYVIYSMESIQSTLDVIHSVLWGAGLLMMGVVGVIAWTVTKSVVGPVSHAAAVSENLAAGDLEERISVKGHDEVARLGISFNRMAAALQSQINELATLSQMQQRFVSDVSHELRTPLTTVRMAAEILHSAREDFTPVNRRSAELLYNQVERFEILLADLLEISRYDAGAAVLDAEPSNIVKIIQQVLDGTRPLAEDAGVEISIESLPEDPILDADHRRIERILRNFVINALEHGEGQPIHIYVGDSPTAMAVAVRDHGIGMTAEDAERVFDRFWRADPARARKTGGSGLGLSIATEDARLHGGWLTAWGEPGNGSAFLLVLPRVPGEPVDVSPLALPPGGDILPLRPESGPSEPIPEIMPEHSTHTSREEP